MENSHYSVLFTGKLRPGCEVAEVKRKLAATFRLDPRALETVFTGKPVVIKRAVDYPTACKYRQAFEAAGAVCIIAPRENPSAAPSPVPPEHRAAETVPKAPLCGFWSRIVAFGVDLLLLGIFGTLLGTIQFDHLAEMGGWGRLFGFGVALLYFGVLNSSLGRGQTIGKRIAKIRVVDRNGAPIPPLRSFLRFAILGTPFFLNGAAVPMHPHFLPMTISIIVLGAGGVLIYLYVANRRTRQSLHDLAVGTFVVRAEAGPLLRFPSLWKGHWWAAGAWIVAAVVLVVAGPSLFLPKPLTDLASLKQAVSAVPGTRAASVSRGKNWGLGGETSFLSVEVAVADLSRPASDVAAEVASLVMVRYPEVVDRDRLIVRVRYGYDIGFASSWRRYVFSRSPRQWRQRLHMRDL